MELMVTLPLNLLVDGTFSVRYAVHIEYAIFENKNVFLP